MKSVLLLSILILPLIAFGQTQKNFEDYFTSTGSGGYTWAQLDQLVGPYINAINPLTGAAYTVDQVSKLTGLDSQVVTDYVIRAQYIHGASVQGVFDQATTNFILQHTTGSATTSKPTVGPSSAAIGRASVGNVINLQGTRAQRYQQYRLNWQRWGYQY